MLYAIVFEIAIKVIWTTDNRTDCRYTHDIASLYSQLSKKSRRAIEKIHRDETTTLAQNKAKMSTKDGKAFEFHSLEEALKANEDTMKNFKYSNRFWGKSSILGAMASNSESVWVLPLIAGARFPRALHEYAACRAAGAGLT